MEQAELRARRAAAQLLGEAQRKSAPEVVGHLLALQAQDLRAARLAVRARSTGLTTADVDRELEAGSLVVGWLMRGTLHLVRREDYHWLHALTAPTRLASNRRRLVQEGVAAAEAEHAVGIIERALAEETPLTRPELAERLRAEGVRTEGQALPHLLLLAALRGVAVLGPVRGGRPACVLARDWLGPAPAVERDTALVELARRYLASHEPATPEDLARWSGLPLRDARAGLTQASERLGAPPPRPPPKLLAAFDPYLLGWKDRAFAVSAEHTRRIHPGGGVLRAAATVAGRAVATWRLRRGQVEIDAFTAIRPQDGAALAIEAEDVVRFEES